MNWLISLLAAALSGIVGLVLAGFIANACVAWYHVSSREGNSGYFVIFLALAGGIASFLIGLVTARLLASHYGPGFGKELGGGVGVILLLAGISALFCRLLADVAPTINGRELNLEVEFRFPNAEGADKPPTAEGEWEFIFASLAGRTRRDYREGTIDSASARFENRQWIVPAKAHLFTERGERSAMLAPKEATNVMSFLLPLPPRPDSKFEVWSDWLPRQQAGGQPWPAEKMSCRFRVQQIPPPPPPQSAEEAKAEEAAQLEAEFVAIPKDAPVQAWFRYLAYDQPHTQRALDLISHRPSLVLELGDLVVSNDPEQAYAALHCIGMLPAPAKELIPAVQAAGREIAARIAKFNSTPAQADPNFEAAVDPATRFYGWMSAVKTLRQKCGGDFTPELKNILELSRVRPESHCMRVDICRVASYHLHQWAGIAPLPTDPKPN